MVVAEDRENYGLAAAGGEVSAERIDFAERAGFGEELSFYGDCVKRPESVPSTPAMGRVWRKASPQGWRAA